MSPGAYVGSHSHDGQLLAVAVNQGEVHSSKMVYLSPWLGVVVVADMKGLGARGPVTTNARYFTLPTAHPLIKYW